MARQSRRVRRNGSPGARGKRTTNVSEANPFFRQEPPPNRDMKFVITNCRRSEAHERCNGTAPVAPDGGRPPFENIGIQDTVLSRVRDRARAIVLVPEPDVQNPDEWTRHPYRALGDHDTVKGLVPSPNYIAAAVLHILW